MNGWRAFGREVRAVNVVVSVTLLAACGGAGVGTAQGDVSTGQVMIEMSEAINALREDNALLQAQVDSLRGEVARQDTLVRRLAAVAGMPVPSR